MQMPKLLFITPVPPSRKGPGISIRAFNALMALSIRYSVYLLIIPVSGVKAPAIDSDVLKIIHSLALLPLNPLKYILLKLAKSLFVTGRFEKPLELMLITDGRLNEAARSFPGIHFDVVHVFRIYMAPYIKSLFDGDFKGRIQLDLDDIESLTRMRMSGLCKLNGNHRMSKQLQFEAKQYECLEREYFPYFERIFVCSNGDKRIIHEKYDCNHIEVLPNIINISEIKNCAGKKDMNDGPFTFLFIGSFGYYPNDDAVIYFCTQIIPLIRANISKPFIFKIVGKYSNTKIPSNILKIPEVDLVGPVDDVRPFYELSDAVVIPIRAGGGTRIKVLEAFAYRKPVVSTSIGIEGIMAKHEQHILIGDMPEDFARQCIRLMCDPIMRANLVENSFSLLRSGYGFDMIKDKLCND
ncbi:Glycosyl transferases group 1 [uncultured archaeon]|nr:Glycosyl transferases group 1 [uncultured archaeon]